MTISNTLKIVTGEDHIALFRQLLDSARSEIIIEVPWIKGASAEFSLRQLPDLKGRGVDVYLLYGYQGPDSDDNDSRLVVEIKKALGRGHMYLLKSGTHAKVLIVDRRLAVIGSWNWLSASYVQRLKNDGLKTVKPHQRREKSLLVTGTGAAMVAAEYIKMLNLPKELRDEKD